MSMDMERKTYSTAPEYFIAGTDIGIAKATKKASAAAVSYTHLDVYKRKGNSGGGAPAGNLNAEKDGAYSRIFFDKLTPAERGTFCLLYTSLYSSL